MRSLFLCLLLFTTVFLSGCVDYEVGIRFDHANRGEIVQRIQLDERLVQLKDATVQQWLKTIEQRTISLGGQIQHRPYTELRDKGLGDRGLQGTELILKIPFRSSSDLEKKFNQFSDTILNLDPLDPMAPNLNPNLEPASESSSENLVPPNSGSPNPSSPDPIPPNQPNRLQLKSHLRIDHSNFVLVERNWLRYDGDLRSLSILSSQGDIVVSPSSLINFDFKLETPWGARIVTNSGTTNSDPTNSDPDSDLNPNNPGPTALNDGRILIWSLTPGTQMVLETIFWLPNPLGLGTVVILILVAVGQLLKGFQSGIFSRGIVSGSAGSTSASGSPIATNRKGASE